ncbi:4Fe-4S ferredoxin N-terminal domain-containing protein [Haloarculaceae archaeon H-GB2-1]|nr:4Fe-4S ferredoxin N-terminal domain-containing protein [Haloarculaceae archaeon H-GB1-1]MEA5386269.1 4Fe-4S ferredoxin N-terminal domain-containing protein [Haloarculaceae archaeon H-GB11]MEA5407772.1 4Fe-4S ferredoxin N-terminal domain-containing protein [Haloarculaceae archaeon H-GB2-1]
MTGPQQPKLTPLPEWDAEADAILDGVEYDADLGKRMARDAIRVSNGEMTDAEFHEKYHEEVLEEFGQDDRPTKPEGFEDD